MDHATRSAHQSTCPADVAAAVGQVWDALPEAVQLAIISQRSLATSTLAPVLAPFEAAARTLVAGKLRDRRLAQP
jgi:hypothetical protein